MIVDRYGSCQMKLTYAPLSYVLKKNSFAYFLVRVVEKCFGYIEFPQKEEKRGRPAHDPCNMIKLIVYAYHMGIRSSIIIADLAKSDKVYNAVSCGLTPSDRSIREFVHNNSDLINYFNELIVYFAILLGLTDYEHIAVDGTIMKAHNSKYNVIHEDDLEIVINYLTDNCEEDNDNLLENLRRPALNFIKRTNISKEDKLTVLYKAKEQFRIRDCNTVPLNDVEACWMHNKSGNNEISYNVQSAVDTKSKIICKLKATSNPTDHYELPNILHETLKRINVIPKYVSADTGYHTQTTIDYLIKTHIKGLVPTSQQTRKIKKKLNENPYHKDHFNYIFEGDFFLCPKNKKLHFKYSYDQKTSKQTDNIRTERKYLNYNECKNCESLEKCTKNTHRTITESGNMRMLEMNNRMEQEENKKEFKKRFSTAEGPFGTLKSFYNINNIKTIGLNAVNNILEICTFSYNLKVIYNLLNKKLKNTSVVDFFNDRMKCLDDINFKLKWEV